MIQIRLGRRLAMLLAALLLCLTAALTVHAADDALAPHAEPGDMDYIRDYIVTVDLREDGSVAIPKPLQPYMGGMTELRKK